LEWEFIWTAVPFRVKEAYGSVSFSFLLQERLTTIAGNNRVKKIFVFMGLDLFLITVLTQIYNVVY
jgi:hypothetical protein